MALLQPLPPFLPIQTALVLEEVKHTAAGVGLPGFPLPGAGAAHMEDQASACAVPPLVCVTEVWFSQDLECNGFHYGAPVRAAGGHDVLKGWRGCRALWLGRSEGRSGRPDDVGGIAGEGDSPTGGIHIYFQCIAVLSCRARRLHRVFGWSGWTPETRAVAALSRTLEPVGL